MIQARAASLVYSDHGKEVFAVRDADLKVRDGEFLGILGPSGSGKSSLLYLLCGLKTPSRGEILYRERDMAKMPESERSELRLRRFGFVFQYPYLLGYLSALENVVLACPGEDRHDEALALLDGLGLGTKNHRLPHEMSGGEKQRVCIARALLGGRETVFADEPTANLDHANGAAVVESLVANRGPGSLVMVTHDPSMLEKADRIVRIADGRIEEEHSYS
ncbi:MAG: ABC transporter ATP-binding protein [Armatimonadetes bacterium]|nr:ABC transporter ATP-binding protein [Armatimonadota bacterium]